MRRITRPAPDFFMDGEHFWTFHGTDWISGGKFAWVYRRTRPDGGRTYHLFPPETVLGCLDYGPQWRMLVVEEGL